jgi:hypothetical protein
MSAFVDDHSITIVSFTNIWDGLIDIEAVGLGVGRIAGPLSPPPPPPQDDNANTITRSLIFLLCMKD